MKNTVKNDPYWTIARFNSIDKNGNKIKKGDEIFYYPATKTALTGAEAEAAYAEFMAYKADEEFYASQY